MGGRCQFWGQSRHHHVWENLCEDLPERIEIRILPLDHVLVRLAWDLSLDLEEDFVSRENPSFFDLKPSDLYFDVRFVQLCFILAANLSHFLTVLCFRFRVVNLLVLFIEFTQVGPLIVLGPS